MKFASERLAKLMISQKIGKQDNFGWSLHYNAALAGKLHAQIALSPAAEAIFISKVKQRGLENVYTIDSCGTGGGLCRCWYDGMGPFYNINGMADPRMIEAAGKRGYDLESRVRVLSKEDISKFNIIAVMDDMNVAAVEEATKFWGVYQEAKPKIFRLREFSTSTPPSLNVQDPYVGSREGFNEVIEILEDCTLNLLDSIEKARKA